jgi:hypothetical protein
MRQVYGPVDAWLHLVPTPELKLKGRVPLPPLPFIRSPDDSLFVCGEARVPFHANFQGVDTDAIRFLVQVRKRGPACYHLRSHIT